MLELGWSEWKNRRNIRKHVFDFADAAQIFQSPLLARLDIREDYGEDRWRGIGMLQGRVVVVIFAEPRPGQVRIISLRKANRHERQAYEKTIQD